MTMAEKIAARRRELNMTLEDVGRIVGVSKSTVRKWETGYIANMRRDKIQALAKALQCTPAYLMGWAEAHDGTGAPDTFSYHPSHRIPILGRVSAGLPLYAEQNIEGYTYTDLNGVDEYFALRVHGDSMDAARINDGDVLIVRRQDCVDNGQIAVVLVDGEDATVKRFYSSEDTITLVPQSTNPQHQIQVYDAKKIDIRVLGRVVENKIQY